VVVDREHDGRERGLELAVERGCAGGQGLRVPCQLEVGAQRVADQRGLGERGAAVAGHVADHRGQATVLQLEHVVEVAAGGGAFGRTVGGRRGSGADALGDRRQQGALQQPDVGGQSPALALDAPRACHGGQRPAAEHEREHGQHADRAPDPARDHANQTFDRADRGQAFARHLARPPARRVGGGARGACAFAAGRATVTRGASSGIAEQRARALARGRAARRCPRSGVPKRGRAGRRGGGREPARERRASRWGTRRG
jgi:hypothetical protein